VNEFIEHTTIQQAIIEKYKTRIEQLEAEIIRLRGDRDAAHARIDEMANEIFRYKKSIEDWKTIDRPVYENVIRCLREKIDNVRKVIS
jgi:uncharacterized coiled-coil DUF342 family protein